MCWKSKIKEKLWDIDLLLLYSHSMLAIIGKKAGGFIALVVKQM